MIPAADAQALGEKLSALDRQTGHQLVVALFQSLGGESLEDYTNRLFRAWKPGSQKANDGVLFALYVQDRRWRVEVGYGLEPVLTDLQAAEIARAGVPYFKSGDYAGGVSVVVERLSAVLTGAERAPRLGDGRVSDDEYDTLVLGAVWGGLLFIVVFFVMGGGGRGGGRTIGRRGGPGYGGYGGFGSWGGWGGGSSGGGWGGGGFGGGGFIGGGGSSGGGGASGGW